MRCEKDVQKKIEDARDKINYAKDEMIHLWCECWNKNQDPSECNFLQDIPKDLFGKFFYYNYKYVRYKAEKNKRKNFRFKFFFVGSLLLAAGIPLIASVISYVGNLNWKSVLLYVGLLEIFVIVTSVVIKKIIDIKKYQEAWARYSMQRYLAEKEMFLYINKMEPYRWEERNQIFALRVIEVWGENENKFVNNIENKEKELADALEHLLQILPKK